MAKCLRCRFHVWLPFLLLSIFKIREWVIQAIPLVLKRAIAAGIGAFLALIALKNAQIIVASPATLVQLGDITSPTFISHCEFLCYRSVDVSRS